VLPYLQLVHEAPPSPDQIGRLIDWIELATPVSQDSDRLQLICSPKLLASLVSVPFDCSLRDFENAADLPGRLALGGPGENLAVSGAAFCR